MDFAPGESLGFPIDRVGGGISRGTGGAFLREAKVGTGGTSGVDFGLLRLPGGFRKRTPAGKAAVGRCSWPRDIDPAVRGRPLISADGRCSVFIFWR